MSTLKGLKNEKGIKAAVVILFLTVARDRWP